MLIQLTVLYELRMKGQHLYKVSNYGVLVTDLRDDGYTATFCTSNVGTRDLISKSMYDVLKQLGLKEPQRNRVLSLSEAAEKQLCWLWFSHSKRENKLMQ